jgi:hypothetical protein
MEGQNKAMPSLTFWRNSGFYDLRFGPTSLFVRAVHLLRSLAASTAGPSQRGNYRSTCIKFMIFDRAFSDCGLSDFNIVYHKPVIMFVYECARRHVRCSSGLVLRFQGADCRPFDNKYFEVI